MISMLYYVCRWWHRNWSCNRRGYRVPITCLSTYILLLFRSMYNIHTYITSMLKIFVNNKRLCSDFHGLSLAVICTAVYPLFSLGMVSIVPLLKFGNFSNPFPNMLNTILIPSEAECGIFQACQIIFIFFSVPVMMIINSCIALTFLYNLYLRPRYENSVLSQ